MGFSEDFAKALEKELKKRKKQVDNVNVKSPYAGDNSRQQDDDDIAPLPDNFMERATSIPDTAEAVAEWRKNSSNKEEKNSGGWFDSGAFSDGKWDSWDLTKTILGTGLDLATEAFEGVWKVGSGLGEGISKNIIAPIMDLTGNHEQANVIRENVKNGVVGKVYDDFMKPLDDVADSNSLLGSKSEGLTQTISRMYALGNIGNAAKMLGLGAKGASVLTTSITFNNSYISGLQEAYQSGATDEEAEVYGVISGLAEAGSELLFGGLGKSINALGYGKGLSNADDMLAAKVTSKMKSTIAKNFTQFAIKAGAEGLEEVIAGFGQALGKNATYMSEEDFGKILEDENLFEQFVMGALVSGGMQSGYLPGTSEGSLRDANKSGKDFVSGLTANEQAVIDKEFNNRVAEAEKNGKLSSKNKNKIYDDVVKALEKGDISTDVIEEVLGGDTYKSYQDTVANEDALRKEYDELGNLKESELTVKQRKRLNELEKQLEEAKTKSERDWLQKKYKSEVYELAKGSKLEESYNERARRGQAFTADLTKYNDKQRAIVQKAIDSGILNNTNKTHDFVDLVARIAGDKGVDFDFLNNAKLKESGFALDGVTVNGYFDSKTKSVGINLNSAKALNTVVGHEITHVLEGTELYSELQNAVIEYAKTKGEYQSRLDTLTELYKGVENADINAELTADLVGDYLFTDADFVNNLSVNHRNVFQKIYDEIKYLCKVVTAGSKEARQLEKVKKAFEDAFRAETKTTSEQIRYSVSYDGKVTEINDGEVSSLKDQLKDNLDKVNELSPVDNITYNPMNKKELKELALSEFKKFGYVIDRQGFGKIEIGEKQISNSLNYLNNYAEKAALLSIPKVLKRGIEIGGHDNHKGRDYSTVTIAAPIEINGQVGNVVVAVRKTGKNRYYAHRVLLPDGSEFIFEANKNAELTSVGIPAASDRPGPTIGSASNKSISQNSEKSTQNTKKSLSAQNEDLGPIGDYNVYGEDVALEGPLPDDYAPITEDEAAIRENEILDSLTDEDAPPEIEMPYYEQRDTGTIEDKALKQISERVSGYLSLSRSDRKVLEEIIQNYSQNENLARDDLYSEIKEKFSVIEESMPNEDVIQVKNEIKNMRLYVSDEIKGDFSEGRSNAYAKFLRSNFGKLRIVKDITQGVPVDSAYEELSSLYPSYFPEDIINPADQIRRIAEIASMPSEDVMPFELSDAEIQSVTDMIYTDISEYMNDVRLNTAIEQSYIPHTDEDAPTVEPESEAENKVLSVRELYDQKLSNYKNTLAAHEAGKERSLANFQEAIGKKLDGYNALKNKNTKRANTLLQQIENLRLRRDNVQADYSNRIAKQQARIEAFESKSFEEFENETLAIRRSELHKQKIDDIKSQFEAQGFDFDEVLNNSKDLWTITTTENTPQRVMEKALGYKEGGILADLTVNKVAQHTTEGIKWLNTITNKKDGLIAQLVKDYNIKPGSKASMAAQMYAEGFWVDKNENIWKYGDEELAKDFPDSKVRENIKGLAKDQRIRQFYDETLKAINESRARNAYPEIQKLDNYFLHFREQSDFFSRNGLPFNPNDMRSKNLPTDVLGTTIDRRPGQPFFASGMHREGKRTSFDIIRGIEMYANSALPQIFYIDDIRTLRALRNYAAESYGKAKGLENLDALPEKEAAAKIKDVYKGHLATFASFLNEEANILAGKTALVDRALGEGAFGRGAIKFMSALNRQAGSNQVGYNASSALTNLLAQVQAFAKGNKVSFIKGQLMTQANKIGALFKHPLDNFAEESPVCVRRRGADKYYRNTWEKLSDPGYLFAGAVDNYTTEVIARAKYDECIRKKKMTPEQAHLETDKWVSRLMGDRSLGQMPLLYNSKMLGIITKYQLEVRNQLDSQFYDTIQEAKASTEDIENTLERNAKKAAKIASTFATLAIGQHLFGKAFEAVAGYNPAFDIIEVLIKAFGFDDEEGEEEPILDNFGQALYELAGDMPYSSFILDGGRVPMANALPDIGQITLGEDDYGRKIGFVPSLVENVAEIAPYYLMPGGYGQLKKTVQGLGMFDDDLPVSGSYTDSGKLRFPVDDNLWKVVQAGFFGQYASENARDYFDNERTALNEKQIQEFVDSGISIQDYWEYREGLSGLKTLNEKADYIYSLDIPIEAKNLFINNLSGRKEEIDLSGMEGFESFEEYDYAQSNPGKYAVSKAVAGDLAEYKQYSKELGAIESDKDKDGKTVSGSRKKNVVNYINGLDLDYGQKIILFRSQYKTDNTYNHEIVDYLNSREDISRETMVAILEELGFKVDGNSVTWD